MGFVFTKRGVIPEACSTWFLPRIVGISKALEMTLTGRVFEAEKGLEYGLISEVLPPEALIPRAREIALGNRSEYFLHFRRPLSPSSLDHAGC